MELQGCGFGGKVDINGFEVGGSIEKLKEH
jgi:hypothetical protein